MTRERLSAAVLAGGQSRRMGQDKALLPLADGGRPMLALVLDALAHVADDIVIVANDGERYRSFGARVVPDQNPGIGALGGIQTAIDQAAHHHTLVVACDMPFLSVPLLQRMADEPRNYDVLAPLTPGESRQRGDGLVFQTLHAIYGKPCLPFIAERIAEGKRNVIGFFADVRVRPLVVTDIAQWDPTLQSFFNANTPEALSIAADINALRERGARS